MLLAVHVPYSYRIERTSTSSHTSSLFVKYTGSRYYNRFDEIFNTTDNIDFGNTTCSVDVGNGRVYLAGLYEEDFEGGPHGFEKSTDNGANHIIKLVSGAENYLRDIGSEGNCLYLYDNDGHRDSRCLYTVRLGPLKSSKQYSFEAKVCLIALRGGGIFSPGGHTKVHLIRDNGQFNAEETFWSQAAPHNVPGGTTVHGRTTVSRQFTPDHDDGYLLGLELWSHDGSNDRCGIQIDDIKIIGEGAVVEPISYIQSKAVYRDVATIGAAKMTWFESAPPGTSIVYNMTVDGVHWVTMQNDTDHIFEHRGSRLMWNATMTTDSEDVSPYIERVIIEYDLFSDPEPNSPSSSEWQGTATPTLEWNFTDPDTGDGQSAYLVELFEDGNVDEAMYNSSWVNSSQWKHRLTENLSDGVYHWRVVTKDDFHVRSNFSQLKKIMIDITRPNGSIVIEEGALSVNEQLVNLAINATDQGSGVADMQIINDRGNAGPWETYAEEKGVALTKEDGLMTIGVRFRDNAGIISNVFNDSIYFDLRGPMDVNLTSPTHPDPAVYYNSTSPVFRWESPHEITGIKGYSYLVDSQRFTEPGKVLYTLNGDMTETSPADFAGLQDGTWYFHIIPCDEYDQWSNSTHFQFNIDTTEPTVSIDSPAEDSWFNSTSVRASAIFEDPNGYGIDTETIQYSKRMHGEGFSHWTSEGMEFEVLSRGIGENPDKVKAWVELELSEGDENGVRWRVTDLSGNGPVGGDVLNIRIDMTLVTFGEPVPGEGEVFSDVLVPCGITISDEGSGVDGMTIEYSISEWGSDDALFKNWSAVGNRMVKGSITVIIDANFEPGSNNYIRWRARDAVGNPFAMSWPVRVWVNTAPEPLIQNPTKWSIIYEGDAFELNGTGTSDENGDELTCYWEIKNKTTKRVVFTGCGMVVDAELAPAGRYIVYLHVDDKLGFNESVNVNIEVLKAAQKPPDGHGPGDGGTGPGGGDGKDGTEKGGILTDYLWVFIIIGAVVLLLILLLIFLIARKRRKDREKQEPLRSTIGGIPTPGPYNAGAQGYTGPGPAQPYTGYGFGGGAQGYPGAGQPGWNRSGPGPGTGRTLPGPYSPQGQQPPLALPPASGGATPMPPYSHSPSSTGQSGVAGPAELPSLPGISDPLDYQANAQPEYSLPIMPTDEGFQDLNLPALPPAPEQSITPEPSPPEANICGPLPTDPYAGALQNPIMPGIDPMGTAIPPTPIPGPVVEPAGAPQMPLPSTSPNTSQSSSPSPLPSPATPSSPVSPSPPLAQSPQFPPSQPSPAGVGPVAFQCYSCGSQNSVDDANRPIVVTCGICGTQSMLTE